MKTYKVRASLDIEVVLEVEAESPEEASHIAGELVSLGDYGDDCISYVGSGDIFWVAEKVCPETVANDSQTEADYNDYVQHNSYP